MKAILVIDKPVNCWQCPCYSDYDCNVLDECIFDDYGNPRDIQCPLKPMPEPKHRVDMECNDVCEHIECGYLEGWNDCLEEIEKC